MKKERLFKCLQKGRVGPCSGFRWPKVGTWVKVEGELSVCENGIHLCREKDLVSWLDDEIYEAEYDGRERLDADEKIVVRRARLKRKLKTWNAKTARLFACDCAAHILPIFEEKHPLDKRPRQTIEVARRYANGKATKRELDAAGDAAWAAAGDVARPWDAARAAAWAAAWPWDAARGAAWGAAWAWAAAGDVARATVAWAAERKWQTRRLMQYLYPLKKKNV